MCVKATKIDPICIQSSYIPDVKLLFTLKRLLQNPNIVN
jgi:hypothetical protein